MTTETYEEWEYQRDNRSLGEAVYRFPQWMDKHPRLAALLDVIHEAEREIHDIMDDLPFGEDDDE